ncbi:MAG: MBL fold metallo-hydrolase [Halioglobus sp.]
MNKIASAALMAGCLIVSLTGLAQSEAPPSVRTTEVTPSLFLLQGRGGNVLASVGVDGILLIDADYAPFAPAYQNALAALAKTGSVPQFVINTHWHGDHTGGNAFWGEQGAVIVAHNNVRQRMSTRQEMKALGKVVEPSPAVALPVVTYGDSLALHFNGDDIEVQHFARGHTDGDSVVFFSAANVVHLGDHFFKDAFPFVDIGSGGSVSAYTANIAALLARVDETTIIIPGHGATSANKADLQRYHNMLVSTSAAVLSKLGQGLSVEDISAQGLDEQWQSWGQGFINEATWIATIAASEQADSGR